MSKKRVTAMLKLRQQKHLTLQEIGDQFGISRERVRQLIGNTGQMNLAAQARKDREALQSAIYLRRTMTRETAAKHYGIAVSTICQIIGPQWKYLLGLGLRRCYRCKSIKSVDEFGVNNRYHYFKISGVCKECNNEYHRRYYRRRAHDQG